MYLGYQGNKIKFYTEQPLDIELYNLDLIEETQDEYVFEEDEYVIKDEAWEERERQRERKRLDTLFMTRSDFFDGFIMAFNLGQTELRTIVENILNSINITDVEIKVALNNFDNALNFYRKHTLFVLLNNVKIPISETMTLVFTSDIWDKFFDTKDYHELQKAIKIKPEPTPEPTEKPLLNSSDETEEVSEN